MLRAARTALADRPSAGWPGWPLTILLVLIVLVGWELYRGARLADRTVRSAVPGQFRLGSGLGCLRGAAVHLTARSSPRCIALLIAVPLGVATALFLTEMAPVRIRQPIITVIEMLAAVPSVIFGLWGIFVLIPWLRDHLFPWLKTRLRLPAACSRARSTA